MHTCSKQGGGARFKFVGYIRDDPNLTTMPLVPNACTFCVTICKLGYSQIDTVLKSSGSIQKLSKIIVFVASDNYYLHNNNYSFTPRSSTVIISNLYCKSVIIVNFRYVSKNKKREERIPCKLFRFNNKQ